MADDPHVPTWRRLLHAEARRLFAPRATRSVAVVLPALTALFGLSKLVLHHTDTATAWRAAEARFARIQADAARYGLPTNDAVGPRLFYDDPRYLMSTLSFGDLRTAFTALAAAVVLFGIVAGGADWSSRVVLTLAAAEPRRDRLFGARALLVTGICAGAAAVTGALLVPLLLLAALLRGSTTGTDGVFWAAFASLYLRGVLLCGLLGLLGYALAMLLRGTATSLGVVFLYLAAAGQVFGGRGPRLAEYDMAGLVYAVLNEKPVIPMIETDCIAGPGCEAAHVDLTHADGFAGIALYVVPVLALALWRFTRTDLGR
ncbi:hypothetical protein M4914_23465 [Streptomyces somaliensis DSM 40738]|uniref:hypothetical protein n=1 Tax=Streptomyces somaliensis TaxID=78355 RepID=UPI0021C464FA|nr:hypothetical protein [Streptomyces somaliensis]MCQ0025604.1 hypothetical protein [Streptomyces somaliensis DSM 40738]